MEELEGADSSRRKFLWASLGSFAAVLLKGAGKARGAVPDEREKEKRPARPRGHRWGMVIDMDTCTACGACVVACSAENNLTLGDPQEAAMGRIIRWLKILPEHEGEYPSPKRTLLPVPCQHCDNPPCTKVCPVYATFRNEEGIVGQVYARCIGCRYCLSACPYTCKFFNWKTPAWPEEMRGSLNPDVSIRPKGVVEKCLFCHSRLQRAKEQAEAQGRPLRESDYQTACAQVCPAKAIVFGDLDDPDTEAARRSQSPRAFHLLEELGTRPKVTYLKEGT